ncbi:MAG: HEAT repeat domain-containing protein, partial [Planctomycetota bacterium]
MRALIAIALFLLPALTASVGAQTREERLDAVQEFKRFFRKFKTVEEQVEAVRTLEGMECVEACDELYALLDHKTPEIARTARAVMSSYREPETFAGYVAQLPDLKDQDKRAALIEIFGVAGQRDAMPEAIRIALEDKKANDDVRYATLRAVATCGYREGVPPLVRALLESSNPLIRMAAGETAASLRLTENGPDLIPRLEDSSWQVQIAAIQGLASIRVQDAVSPLIELMGKGGRASEECADALFRITALDLPVDVDVWRTTWERLSSIDGWRIPTDEELAKKAANRKKYDALYGAKSDEATTFG